MRRVLCLWFPRLPANRIERREAPLRDMPIAFVAEAANRVLLHALNARAETAGLRAGMALADACAICPGLHTRPADPRADAAMLKGLARWMERYSPLVAADGDDGLFADMTGGEHLFGGDARLISRVMSGIEGLGITVRAALADTPGAAHALARFGNGCTIVEPGSARAVLAPLPVAALRAGAEMSDACRRLGLRTIGDLYPLPRASLSARFGLGAVQRLDQALGQEEEPLCPIRFAAAPRAGMIFPEPVARTEDVEAALALLLERLCKHLERGGIGARAIILTIERVDASRQSLHVATTRSSRSPQALLRLFRERLDRLDAGFGIERADVTAGHCEPLDAEQMHGSGEPDAKDSDEALIDRLLNRFGPDHVLRLTPAQSHLPERAFLTCSAAHTPPSPGWISPHMARPLRLLNRPEPVAKIEDTQDLMPPAVILWQGRGVAVTPLAGPERIEPEWWHDYPAWRGGARDYWWVRTDCGHLLWLFRTGRAEESPRWFLHGLGA